MKLVRILLLATTVIVLGGVAYFAREQQPVGTQMTEAASKWLDSLTAEQKAKASFEFNNKERTNWIFVPMQDEQRKPTRKGLRLEEMTDAQKQGVLALLRSGLSESGYKQVVTIMSLESLLNDLEKNGRMVRNPGWYFVSIFGTPAATGRWGWRVEGHHLSLNFTVVDGQVASATPCFFGANPAEVKSGERKGLRVIGDVEESAFELYQSLDESQQKEALQAKHFGEPSDKVAAEKVGAPVGLSSAKMNEKQKELLQKLLASYIARMPASVGDAQWKSVREGGLDKIHFAFTGQPKSGQPHTYRVQGPTFIVQFLNVQNDSAGNKNNHIHSAWRELPSDFGL